MIEPVGADLVALAQAHALDATTFPYPSLPVVLGADAPPSLWVARTEHGGRVVGYVATRARAGALEISGLATDAAHRRTGLGRALVRAAVRSARSRGLALVSLHVSTGNDGAIRLYVSEGFRTERRIAGYYRVASFPDDGDAWLMIRDVLIS